MVDGLLLFCSWHLGWIDIWFLFFFAGLLYDLLISFFETLQHAAFTKWDIRTPGYKIWQQNINSLNLVKVEKLTSRDPFTFTRSPLSCSYVKVDFVSTKPSSRKSNPIFTSFFKKKELSCPSHKYNTNPNDISKKFQFSIGPIGEFWEGRDLNHEFVKGNFVCSREVMKIGGHSRHKKKLPSSQKSIWIDIKQNVKVIYLFHQLHAVLWGDHHQACP